MGNRLESHEELPTAYQEIAKRQAELERIMATGFRAFPSRGLVVTDAMIEDLRINDGT